MDDMTNPTYGVNDIYRTFQGEGAFIGRPMILIRLQGCEVGCRFCDTKETWALAPRMRKETIHEARKEPAWWVGLKAASIAEHAKETSRNSGIAWALITGGEPAAYPLRPLVDALRDAGFQSAIETSGTARGHIDAGADWVTVSPKFHQPGGLPVLDDALAVADEIKLVPRNAGDIHDLDRALARIPRDWRPEISLQPIWDDPTSLALCRSHCESRGWRFSLQAHKYLGIK